MSSWKHIGTCVDGQRFSIAGLNVWDYEWLRRAGESADITDPQYGQPRTFPVYNITDGERCITFAAGELSNCVWGFYTRAS